MSLLTASLSASCCFSSLLSSWLPWIYSPFPFFMESCNGLLLQLIECIESTRNEVKRKMIAESVRDSAPRSQRAPRSAESVGLLRCPLIFLRTRSEFLRTQQFNLENPDSTLGV